MRHHDGNAGENGLKTFHPKTVWKTALLGLSLASLLWTAPSPPAWAADRVVRLASLEWPPYTTASDGHGASDAVVRAAFAAVGYKVEIQYIPWQRAMLSVREGKGDADGVFPTYAAPERNDFCSWSDPIGQSPVGFVERRDSPIVWNSLADLAPYHLGVVQGYVNTAEFDAMAARGELTVEKATDDASNLRKVLARRVRAAVIDRNVMRYLLSSDPSLHDGLQTLQFNSHLLDNKPIYVCFRKNPSGAVLAGALNDGLKKIDSTAVASRALKGLGW